MLLDSKHSRKEMHATFNKWLQDCSEEEFQKFQELKKLLSYGRPCSLGQIIQMAWNRADIVHLIPMSLAQQLEAVSLLPESVGEPSAEAG